MINFSFSVVSHNQINLIKLLFEDFKKLKNISFEVILTLNTPEDFNEDDYTNHLPQRNSQVS